MISPEQLADAVRVQGQQLGGERLGEVLLTEGHITAGQLEELLAAQQEWLDAEGSRLALGDGAGTADLSLHHLSVEDITGEHAVFDPNSFVDLDRQFADLLQTAALKSASDLHVQTGSRPFLRVLGEIEPLPGDTLTEEQVRAMLRSILDEGQQATLSAEGDLDFGWQHTGIGRFRINCFEGARGPGIVARLVPARIPTLDELSLPSVVARATTYHQGLVLVTGPSGSGKSSTVAALVRMINEERKHNILSLEDPVEFLHESMRSNVIQRQIPDHSTSFSTALRAALREDPDVIVIGEMRDPETISLAISAAETGHLVLGTMHTSGVASTIDRVIASFPTEQHEQVRAMLSESLRAIISQHLLRRADGMGRVPAVEILFNSPAAAKLIRDSRTFQLANILQTSRGQGMRSLQDSLNELTKSRVITADEAARAQA
ncbi:MAG TPA: type IV pili twitching motility protein PilT [Deltaproteobacteria bacterium]|nr:type IV pili twitching motility protein PilT [Deltaproteobacteria bacterium]